MYTEEDREKIRKRPYTERMADFGEPLSEDQTHLDSIKEEKREFPNDLTIRATMRCLGL